MSDETWVRHPKWDQYSISDRGRVRRHRKTVSPNVLETFATTGGYRAVTLSQNGIRTTIRVHRLVLEAFVGPRPEGLVCSHKNGDRRDNRLANIEWVTQTENEAMKSLHGTRREGERHHSAKLTAADVRRARGLREKGHTYAAIAAAFNCTGEAIRSACTGATWKSVDQ